MQINEINRESLPFRGLIMRFNEINRESFPRRGAVYQPGGKPHQCAWEAGLQTAPLRGKDSQIKLLICIINASKGKRPIPRLFLLKHIIEPPLEARMHQL